jgi:hypothetical protein
MGNRRNESVVVKTNVIDRILSEGTFNYSISKKAGARAPAFVHFNLRSRTCCRYQHFPFFSDSVLLLFHLFYYDTICRRLSNILHFQFSNALHAFVGYPSISNANLQLANYHSLHGFSLQDKRTITQHIDGVV